MVAPQEGNAFASVPLAEALDDVFPVLAGILAEIVEPRGRSIIGATRASTVPGAVRLAPISAGAFDVLASAA
jgi:hypothetical protein